MLFHSACLRGGNHFEPGKYSQSNPQRTLRSAKHAVRTHEAKRSSYLRSEAQFALAQRSGARTHGAKRSSHSRSAAERSPSFFAFFLSNVWYFKKLSYLCTALVEKQDSKERTGV